MLCVSHDPVTPRAHARRTGDNAVDCEPKARGIIIIIISLHGTRDVVNANLKFKSETRSVHTRSSYCARRGRYVYTSRTYTCTVIK